jgi:uncharacterized membrane protein
LCLVGVLLVIGPLLGYPPVLRVHALVAAVALFAVFVCRQQVIQLAAHDPGGQSAATAAGAIAIASLALFWIVLTRFLSGEINAVDFTVYFDRPCFQTVNGRPWLVETAGLPEYSGRSSLYHHAYWMMLPICSLYAIHPTPFWLLAFSVTAVVAGAVHVYRIMDILGAGGTLAGSAALVFLLNEHTAGTLSYGFHPEVLYAWFIPWAIEAALRSSRRQFALAVICTALVKEGAILPLFSLSMAIGLQRFRQLSWPDRMLFLVAPVALAAVNLFVFLEIVAPLHSPDGRPATAGFWQGYGAGPIAAGGAMLSQPGRVLEAVAASPFWTRILPAFLFLPVLGWRWTVGVLPTIVIFSTSSFPQLRAFGLYYPMLVVPFLVIGAAAGAQAVVRRLSPCSGNLSLVAASLLLPAMFAGGFDRGYSLRPWRSEVLALPDALAKLSKERVVLVQSSLYPHAGYDPRIKLLTHHTLGDPRYRDAAIVVAEGMHSFPLDADEIARLGRLPPIDSMPPGLVAVRLPEGSQVALPSTTAAAPR